MKKFWIFIMALFLLPVGGKAASTDFKIINDINFQKVMSDSGVSAKDMELYQTIFTALKENKIEKATVFEKKLDGDILLGHILAEKYLHKDYNVSYKELKDWLKKYPNLPQYQRIKNLSVVKAPNYKPQKDVSTDKKKLFASYDWYRAKYKNLSQKNRIFIKNNLDKFLISIRSTDHDEAVKILNNSKFKKIMPHRQYDDMCATLASAYFLEGNNKEALKWSKKAVLRSRNATAAWFGGLAAWREKDYKTAESYFSRLSKLKRGDKWLVSAGAYWAYRANVKLNRLDKASANLRVAAKYPYTFYGILAEYRLKKSFSRNWKTRHYYNPKTYMNDILLSSSIKRAILLASIGKNDLAAEDLRRNYMKMNARQKELLLYISAQYNLPYLGFFVADDLQKHLVNRNYNRYLYPTPSWKPNQNWQVDQAWIWALTRQESRFLPKARSHAGACGLMQIMPTTAAEVTGKKRYKKNWASLFETKKNLSIGQDYVNILRNKDFIGDNLMFLAAAYNAGPKSLQKWVESVEYDDDVLMFMERIPWRETRLYVKRVITNYWIYNSRLGEENQSLEQLCQGYWPLLNSED